MKTTKEKANELVEKFLPEVRGADRYNYNLEDMNVFIAKQCAINAVKHTIEVLGKTQENRFTTIIVKTIDEQTEILNELKSRL